MMLPTDDDCNGRTTDSNEAGYLPHTFAGHAHSPRPNMQLASQPRAPLIINDINMIRGCPNLNRLNESYATPPWNNANSRGTLRSSQGTEVGHPVDANNTTGIGYLMNPAACSMENGESSMNSDSAIRRFPGSFDLIVERQGNVMRTVRPSFDRSFQTHGAGVSSLIRPNRNFSSTHVASRLQDSSPSLRGFSPLGQNTNKLMDLSQLRGRSASTQAAEFPNSSFNTVGGLYANGGGAGQPTPLLHGHFGQSIITVPTEPSTTYHTGLNPITCAQSGNVIRPSEGTHTQISHIGCSRPPHLPLRPSHPRTSFPAGTRWSQNPENFPFPSSGSAPFPFPRRLGIQPNGVANADITRGQHHPFQNYEGSGFMQRPVRPPVFSDQVIPSAAPFNVGGQTIRPSVHNSGAQVRARPILPSVHDPGAQLIPPAERFDVRAQAILLSSHNPRAHLIQPAARFEVRPHAITPSVHNTQAEVIPPAAQFDVEPQAISDYNRGGQVIPSAARFDVRPQGIQPPPMKRGPPEYLYTAQVSQRRKILPPPPILNQMQQSLSAAADRGLPPFHVKWTGFSDPLPLSGHKCQLCKRELSFSSEEGQLHQPDRLPAVAVLQCGHVFHDLCLERITPSDQKKSPPCIPCAIGD